MAEAAMELRVAQAIALQSNLAREVICKDGFDTVRYVCGIDVQFTEDGPARAAAAVLTFPQLELCDYAVVRKAVRFPYIPGLLSFREAPPALAALDKLTVTPELLLCDGHGIAHPRRFGLASHIGLLAGIPSIGVAKTRLVGVHAEPPQGRGAWEPLVDRGECIGAVLRTRTGVRPVYVSVGHG